MRLNEEVDRILLHLPLNNGLYERILKGLNVLVYDIFTHLAVQGVITKL